MNLPALQLQVAMGLPLHLIPDVRKMYGRDPLGTEEIDFDNGEECCYEQSDASRLDPIRSDPPPVVYDGAEQLSPSSITPILYETLVLAIIVRSLSSYILCVYRGASRGARALHSCAHHRRESRPRVSGKKGIVINRRFTKGVLRVFLFCYHSRIISPCGRAMQYSTERFGLEGLVVTVSLLEDRKHVSGFYGMRGPKAFGDCANRG